MGDAARAVEPAADLHAAAGADQGQADLMTVFAGAVDATFAAFGIDAVYTPTGGEPVPVRVIARRPDTIVGFGETRIHAETATFEVRVSEVTSPRPGDQLTSAVRASSSRASRSGAIRIGWSGASRRDRCEEDGAQVGLRRRSKRKPAMAPTTPITSRVQYSVVGASLTASPVSRAGARRRHLHIDERDGGDDRQNDTAPLQRAG
jgi:hypothetical protein